ncbi:beta-microseminoprotein [Peromyscus maniculatus bairdii]|uniref:beta-microseminoprotein n=1 Tax=Peromyscus maniculatus bairdii TaxID=230844 RepID=UPI00042AEC54|nr:beta-microseminoprotein [Peromyscus maniculatus bairdii]
MKALLGSLLFLATLVTACNAGCTFQQRENLPDQPPDGCLDSAGIKHSVGAQWTVDCKKCFCEKAGISCCPQTLIPKGYDQEKCKTIFHQKECRYTVVEKNNEGIICPVDSWTL